MIEPITINCPIERIHFIVIGFFYVFEDMLIVILIKIEAYNLL